MRCNTTFAIDNANLSVFALVIGSKQLVQHIRSSNTFSQQPQSFRAVTNIG
jgi:hypothetical protein